MKKQVVILFSLILLSSIAIAQKNKNLTVKEVGNIEKIWESIPYVRPGEFKVDFSKMYFDAIRKEYNYRYFVIVRDRNDKPCKAIMNTEVINFANYEIPVEILRAGFKEKDYVYISKDKTSTVDNERIIYNLHLEGNTYGPYDGIETVLPKGFVYKNKNLYLYTEYDDNVLSLKNYDVAEQAEYEGEYIQCSINDKMLKFVPNGKVHYFKCYDGHYHILYNDDAMTNTLLIVDGVGYEITDAVDSINLKFSHDGEHWVASGYNYVMVDGVTVTRLSKHIKDVAINNKGDYFYVVEGEGFGDRAYLNSNIVVDGVEFKSLNVDDDEVFNYICCNDKGFFYGLDNDIMDYSDNMQDYYYPALKDDRQSFAIKSDDGTHIMEYNSDSPFITIDNERIESVTPPHYAVWNEEEQCFMWNTIENWKLFVRKYKVKNK